MNKKKIKRLYKFAVRFRGKENEQNKKYKIKKNILKYCTQEQQAQRKIPSINVCCNSHTRLCQCL